MRNSKFKCRKLLLILLGCACLMPASCNRRQANNEKLQRQWNVKCKEAADLLAAVNDVPGAKAAEPKLKLALEEMAKLNEQLGKSYDPENVDPSESPGMTREVANGIAEMQRVNMETLRISKNPDLVAALGKTWKKLPSVVMLEASGAIPKSNR